MNLKKNVAILTTICFLVSCVFNQALYATVEMRQNTGQFKQLLDDFAIPASLGHISKARFYDSGKVVVNIQDLHCHPEVQRNISRLIGLLDGKYQLKNVYVEGASGNVSTAWLTDIADAKSRNEIVEALVDQGKLTGSEYYSVTQRRPDLLRGMEDEGPYDQNIVRLGKILEKKEYFAQKTAALDEDLSAMQLRYFNGKNRNFDRLVNEHRQGKISTEKYYRILGKYVETINDHPEKYDNVFVIDKSKYANLWGYLELVDAGKKLHYRNVARQLQQFVSVLKQKLPYSAYNYLVEKTDNFTKLDELYVYLARISREYNLDLAESFPDLNRFFAYIEKGQAVNPLQLVKEERKLVEQIRLGLSQDRSELEVSFLSDFFVYFSDYLNNRLSADDYAYFVSQFDQFKTLWDKYAFRNRLTELQGDFALLDDFYRVNVARNDYFMKNMLGAYTNTGSAASAQGLGDNIHRTVESLGKADEILVVVAGGFHTDGLEKLLDERHISYLDITPNVTRNTKQSDAVYMEIAKQQAKILSQAIALKMLSTMDPKNKDYAIASALVAAHLQKVALNEVNKKQLATELQRRDMKIISLSDSELVVQDKTGRKMTIDLKAGADKGLLKAMKNGRNELWGPVKAATKDAVQAAMTAWDVEENAFNPEKVYDILKAIGLSETALETFKASELSKGLVYRAYALEQPSIDGVGKDVMAMLPPAFQNMIVTHVGKEDAVKQAAEAKKLFAILYSVNYIYDLAVALETTNKPKQARNIAVSGAESLSDALEGLQQAVVYDTVEKEKGISVVDADDNEYHYVLSSNGNIAVITKVPVDSKQKKVLEGKFNWEGKEINVQNVKGPIRGVAAFHLKQYSLEGSRKVVHLMVIDSDKRVHVLKQTPDSGGYEENSEASGKLNVTHMKGLDSVRFTREGGKNVIYGFGPDGVSRIVNPSGNDWTGGLIDLTGEELNMKHKGDPLVKVDMFSGKTGTLFYSIGKSGSVGMHLPYTSEKFNIEELQDLTKELQNKHGENLIDVQVVEAGKFPIIFGIGSDGTISEFHRIPDSGKPTGYRWAYAKNSSPVVSDYMQTHHSRAGLASLQVTLRDNTLHFFGTGNDGSVSEFKYQIKIENGNVMPVYSDSEKAGAEYGLQHKINAFVGKKISTFAARNIAVRIPGRGRLGSKRFVVYPEHITVGGKDRYALTNDRFEFHYVLTPDGRVALVAKVPEVDVNGDPTGHFDLKADPLKALNEKIAELPEPNRQLRSFEVQHSITHGESGSFSVLYFMIIDGKGQARVFKQVVPGKEGKEGYEELSDANNALNEAGSLQALRFVKENGIDTIYGIGFDGRIARVSVSYKQEGPAGKYLTGGYKWEGGLLKDLTKQLKDEHMLGFSAVHVMRDDYGTVFYSLGNDGSFAVNYRTDKDKANAAGIAKDRLNDADIRYLNDNLRKGLLDDETLMDVQVIEKDKVSFFFGIGSKGTVTEIRRIPDTGNKYRWETERDDARSNYFRAQHAQLVSLQVVLSFENDTLHFFGTGADGTVSEFRYKITFGKDFKIEESKPRGTTVGNRLFKKINEITGVSALKESRNTLVTATEIALEATGVGIIYEKLVDIEQDIYRKGLRDKIVAGNIIRYTAQGEAYQLNLKEEESGRAAEEKVSAADSVGRKIEGLYGQLRNIKDGNISLQVKDFLKKYQERNHIPDKEMPGLYEELAGVDIYMDKNAIYLDIAQNRDVVIAHTGGLRPNETPRIWIGQREIEELNDLDLLKIIFEEGLHVWKPAGEHEVDIFHDNEFLLEIVNKLENKGIRYHKIAGDFIEYLNKQLEPKKDPDDRDPAVYTDTDDRDPGLEKVREKLITDMEKYLQKFRPEITEGKRADVAEAIVNGNMFLIGLGDHYDLDPYGGERLRYMDLPNVTKKKQAQEQPAAEAPAAIEHAISFNDGLLIADEFFTYIKSHVKEAQKDEGLEDVRKLLVKDVIDYLQLPATRKAHPEVPAEKIEAAAEEIVNSQMFLAGKTDRYYNIWPMAAGREKLRYMNVTGAATIDSTLMMLMTKIYDIVDSLIKGRGNETGQKVSVLYTAVPEQRARAVENVLKTNSPEIKPGAQRIEGIVLTLQTKADDLDGTQPVALSSMDITLQDGTPVRIGGIFERNENGIRTWYVSFGKEDISKYNEEELMSFSAAAIAKQIDAEENSTNLPKIGLVVDNYQKQDKRSSAWRQYGKAVSYNALDNLYQDDFDMPDFLSNLIAKNQAEMDARREMIAYIGKIDVKAGSPEVKDYQKIKKNGSIMLDAANYTDKSGELTPALLKALKETVALAHSDTRDPSGLKVYLRHEVNDRNINELPRVLTELAGTRVDSVYLDLSRINNADRIIEVLDKYKASHAPVPLVVGVDETNAAVRTAIDAVKAKYAESGRIKFVKRITIGANTLDNEGRPVTENEIETILKNLQKYEVVEINIDNGKDGEGNGAAAAKQLKTVSEMDFGNPIIFHLDEVRGIYQKDRSIINGSLDWFRELFDNESAEDRAAYEARVASKLDRRYLSQVSGEELVNMLKDINEKGITGMPVIKNSAVHMHLSELYGDFHAAGSAEEKAAVEKAIRSYLTTIAARTLAKEDLDGKAKQQGLADAEFEMAQGKYLLFVKMHPLGAVSMDEDLTTKFKKIKNAINGNDSYATYGDIVVMINELREEIKDIENDPAALKRQVTPRQAAVLSGMLDILPLLDERVTYRDIKRGNISSFDSKMVTRILAAA